MRRPTPRQLEGIPGTVEPGFHEREIVELPLDRRAADVMEILTPGVSKTLRQFTMGPCNILIGHEPVGPGRAPLWHLTISTPSRHPTWDEIKVARYRLLPLDITVAMMLPPPEQYVNVPEQDHVMQLWEIQDPRG